MKALLASLILLCGANVFALTDREAVELGMTPIENLSLSNKGNGFSPNLDDVFEKAEVVVVIDKSRRSIKNAQGQTATVYIGGSFYSIYDVSTGTEEVKTTTSGRQYIATTPVGIYRPIRAYTDYMSRTFLGSPMTWAVFFNGGIALHSTTRSQYSRLGTRASGGCVRMKLEEAEEVNQMIVTRGEPNMRTVDQSEMIDDVLLKRILYINREKFPKVNVKTGEHQVEKIWTYDSLIVVVGV